MYQNPTGIPLATTQELVRGNGAAVSSLDPHKAERAPECNVLRDLMEGLVIQDAAGNAIPGAAESWEIQRDQRFEFNLRQDAKWSNGDPVTAYDFEYSFRRVADPSTASPHSWYVERARIKNARDVISGAKDKSELGVTAVDARTLVLETEVPAPHLVQMLAHAAAYPVHRATVERWGDAWVTPEHYVSNGAYALRGRSAAEGVVLVRNGNYWDDGSTLIDKVTYLAFESLSEEMDRFLSAGIHMTDGFPDEKFRWLLKEHPQSVAVSPYLCTSYFGFNNERPPFDDVRVRKALSYAIDRDIITKAVLGQGQQNAYGLTHRGIADFSPDKPEYAALTQAERVAKARELLSEAGFTSGSPLRFTVLSSMDDNDKRLAAAVQSLWARSLGSLVVVELEAQDWSAYLARSRRGDFDVRYASWRADYNEASAFLSMATAGSAVNCERYSSAAFDRAMNDAATRAKTAEERSPFYSIAEAQLVKDMPIAPVFEGVRSRLVNARVGGYPMGNPHGTVYSKDLCLMQG
ncbi:MAG: oligopeptide ABC transporter substrate-binding protein OppA [Myxococcales bacterium]|nr:oligopeptide ABC transporter substrate-binding protein OppA [Myxococcales bacterium]